MSSKEITHVHELLAQYNAILSFSQNNLRSEMDKPMADSVRAISPAFDSYKSAIVELEKAIEKAGVELKRHKAWPGLTLAAESFEQKDEDEVERLIQKNLEALNDNADSTGQGEVRTGVR